MTIRQLSVFLENKPGYLDEMLSVLAENNINIVALTIADTSDYGIVRLLVSNPQMALDKLREKQYTVRIHHIISLEMEKKVGSLYKILDLFTRASINVEYIYAFSFGNKSIMVVRTDNQDKAAEVVRQHHLKPISEEELE
ncbi:MAG: ACT domain-containing protein [Paludibacteraceae bacterium]